jgi:hypothetical protein
VAEFEPNNLLEFCTFWDNIPVFVTRALIQTLETRKERKSVGEDEFELAFLGILSRSTHMPEVFN